MLLSGFIVVIWDQRLWGSVSPCSTKKDSFPGTLSLVAISDLGIGVYRADLLSHEGASSL